MNFQQMKTFCAVLDEQSMTGAAKKLYLTQPAVSQQIRQLEEHVGVDLFVRGVRQVKPTPQGERLYDYAQRILDLSEKAELAIQSMGAEVSGLLRVGTLNSIGLHLIGPVFSMFLKNNHAVRLQSHYASGRQLMTLLDNNEIDLAVLPDAFQQFGDEPKDCKKFKLTETHMRLAVSGKDIYLPSTIPLKSLNLRPLVQMCGEYPGFEMSLKREIKKAGMTVKPIFESSNVGTLKRIVESGIGWGFLPTHSIRKHVQTGRMRLIEIENFEYKVDLVCYCPKTKSNDPTMEVFLKAIMGRQ